MKQKQKSLQKSAHLQVLTLVPPLEVGLSYQRNAREDVLEESFELLKTRNQLTSLSRRPGEKFDSLFCAVRTQSHGDISINLVKWSVTGRIELHFLPRDVETDDLCSGPQTPSSQLERGCVSIYFPVSPSPLFRTQTLCAQAAGGFCSGWCRVFFFLTSHFLQLLRNKLCLAEDGI